MAGSAKKAARLMPRCSFVGTFSVDATLSVLASGTRYAAVDWADARSPKVLWQGDTEEEIFAWHYSTALQPTGKQVAFCMRKIKTVSVRDATTGNELRKLAAAVHNQRHARKCEQSGGGDDAAVDELIEALQTGISRVSTLR